MLAITRNVWNGTDYLPFVWERWLYEARGLVIVAAIDNRVVGLQHMALQPDGSAWLEGIRVAEDARRRGVGEALLAYGVAWSRQMGSPAVRLSIASHNPASNHLACKGGFRVVGTFLACSAAPGGLPKQRCVRVAHAADARRILDFVRRTAHAPESAPFYTEGWTAYRLTEERLRLLLVTNAVVVVGDSEIDGVAIATATVARAALRLGFLAGDRDAATALCNWLRAAALEARLPRIRATVQVDATGIESLQRSGFDRSEDVRMLLYELPLV